jgi:integrase
MSICILYYRVAHGTRSTDWTPENGFLRKEQNDLLGRIQMALYKRGDIWWYKFTYAGQRIRESSKSTSKTVAGDAERKRRRELEKGFNGISDQRRERVRTLADVAAEYLADYGLKHRASTFARYAIGHVTRLLGERMLAEISDKMIRQYQTARLNEGAAPKSINEEVGFLLRLLRDQGDALRSALRQQKALKLAVRTTPGRAFSPEEQARMLNYARASTIAARALMERRERREKPEANEAQGGSPNIYPALVLALNAGMRDAEIRSLTWEQIDLKKRVLTVGRAKTEAGEGRTIPLNESIHEALSEHAAWFVRRFKATRPAWCVFPGGGKLPSDPTKPVTTLKTAWAAVRKAAAVRGRWHDARHTLITELAESGAGDQTIMDIAGHVSRQMLQRYSHIRMEAKRMALLDVERRRRSA